MTARSPLARLLPQARPDAILAFLHGEDASAIAEQVAAARTRLGEDTDVVTVTDGELRDDRGALAGAAGARSLFGGATLVLHPMEEPSRTAAALTQLLAIEGEPNPVIVTAGVLTAKNKALAVAQADRRVHVQAFAAPAPEAMGRLMREAALAAGLRPDDAGLDRLLAEAGTDRRLAALEIEKLALLLDARPGLPVDASLADVEAIVANSAAGADAVPTADAVLWGRTAEVADWLADASGTEVDGVVRALTRRAWQMTAVAGRGGDADTVRRVGGADAGGLFARLDRRLPPARLAHLAEALGELEALTRTSRPHAGAEIRQRLLRLATSLA